MELTYLNLTIQTISSECDALPIQMLIATEDFSTSNTKFLKEDSNE